MRKKKIPAWWPKTLRVVIEDCNFDGVIQFHALQSDEEPPEDILGMAMYRFEKLEKIKKITSQD